MSEPILVPLGEGEVIGDSSDRRVDILSDHVTVLWHTFPSAST